MADTEMVYVTKHAIAGGIQHVPVTIEPGSQYAYGAAGWHVQYVGEGKDWHRTFDSAKARAENMRQAKISSLKKQIAKLEKMIFEAPAS